MANAFMVSGLTKTYQDFVLDHVSFTVPSSLDPVVRDDILDMLLDFVQDEEHSILVSSHITSDAASKWNKNVITMPVSRKQIIGEKFLFYILLAALGLLTALIPCHFCYLFFFHTGLR